MQSNSPDSERSEPAGSRSENPHFERAKWSEGGAVYRGNGKHFGEGNRISPIVQPAMLASSPCLEAGKINEQSPPPPSVKKERQESPDDSQSDEENQEKPNNSKQSENEKPKGPPLYKRPLPMAILIAMVLFLAIGGILYWLHARQFQSTDDAFIEAHVTPISPRVAAQVRSVWIDDNALVRQGQVLVQLDDRDFQAAVRQAKATEASMRATLAQAQSMQAVAQAGVEENQAELAVAQVNFENADRDFKRYLALDERARSQQQLDNATAAERSNQAQVLQGNAKVAQARAQVASANSQIVAAQANVDRAAADLQTAELNLSYCTITSPQDGYITRKNVEPGSYVQVGQVLFSTVPNDVWVTANFKETQLDLMRPGQPVEVRLDAFPDKTFHGKVDSIEAGTGARFSLLPPENATGNYVKVVQRIPVKIVFNAGETDDPEHVLGVGMSVDPQVKVR
jgi:membrane fusion protein, multidrug efflux system